MNRALRRLDSIHSKLLTTLASIEEPLFSRRASDDEWSVAEIVHHLCLVERRVVKVLEQQLTQPPAKISAFRRLIPTSIVALRLVKVKAPKAMNPIEPPPPNDLIENYNSVRNRLKELYATHGRQRLRQVVFKHPFLGDIDGTAAVAFAGYHEVRHLKQIKEVLRKLARK